MSLVHERLSARRGDHRRRHRARARDEGAPRRSRRRDAVPPRSHDRRGDHAAPRGAPRGGARRRGVRLLLRPAPVHARRRGRAVRPHLHHDVRRERRHLHPHPEAPGGATGRGSARAPDRRAPRGEPRPRGRPRRAGRGGGLRPEGLGGVRDARGLPARSRGERARCARGAPRRRGPRSVRARRRPLGSEQRTLLDAFARQAALALDRVRLAEEARQAALRVKTEELRSGLLSAVSHDLRTPLAAITGAGTMLRDEAALDPALRRDLVETVCEEAERLERLVSNLLDMTRLDSGAVEPKREWVPLVEVIGGALTRLERRLAARKITTAIADDVPLLSIDPVLVEQLFLNLLENAAKYTPPSSDIDIRAAREGGTLVVDVADR